MRQYYKKNLGTIQYCVRLIYIQSYRKVRDMLENIITFLEIKLITTKSKST